MDGYGAADGTRSGAAAVSIADTPEWSALSAHHAALAERHLRDLFADDPTRGDTSLTAAAGDLFLDYSKNRVTAETMRLLVALAERAGLRERIDAMFRGERINVTEDRAVLHVALRAPAGAVIEVDGHNVVPDVHEVLDRMGDLADRVRSGAWRGFSERPIRNVVNIGIGGSDLGPAMAYEALRDEVTSDRPLVAQLRQEPLARRGRVRDRLDGRERLRGDDEQRLLWIEVGRCLPDVVAVDVRDEAHSQ